MSFGNREKSPPPGFRACSALTLTHEANKLFSLHSATQCFAFSSVTILIDVIKCARTRCENNQVKWLNTRIYRIISQFYLFNLPLYRTNTQKPHTIFTGLHYVIASPNAYHFWYFKVSSYPKVLFA